MSEYRYYLYARKSTIGEDRQSLSIQSQLRRAREMFPDLNIIKVVEERQSAFEPGKRQNFADMLADIDAGQADGIIAWHPDRLSRNEEDAAKITYRTRKGIIKDLRFCSYNFDNSAEGIMMLQMALSQSQYFSAKLGKDVRRGMEQKLKIGWLPRMAPIGYLNEIVDHTVVVDDERFKLVRRMWDLLITGLYTPARICQIAEEEWGLTTVKRKRIGGSPLSRGGVYRLFRDPFYAGLILWDGQIYQGNHQPMVTLEEFKRAQAILDRGQNRAGKLVKHDFPYRGLIICGECGAQFTAEIQKKHVYYHCTRRKTTVKCHQHSSLRHEKIETRIIDVMSSHTIHAGFRSWALKYIDIAAPVDAEDSEQIRLSRSARVQQLKGQLDRLLDLKLDDLVDDEDFKQKQGSMKAEIATLEQEIAEADGLKRRLDLQTRRALDLATYGLSVLQYGSSHKKRVIASKIASAYVAQDGELTIEVRKWLIPFQRATDSGGPPRSTTGHAAISDVRTSRAQYNASAMRKTAASAAVCSLWQSIVDDVRTALHEVIDEIDLPEFDAFGDIGDL